MNAPEVIPLAKESVPPGGSVTISISFTAPLEGGSYRADFKLRNAAGVLFSFKDPSQTFWVEIQVMTGKIDLVAMACSIRWTSASGELPCPGLPTDTRGFAFTDLAPVLENGSKDNEPALWLGVQQSQDGILRGTLPDHADPGKRQIQHNFGLCERSGVLRRDFAAKLPGRRQTSG